MLLRLRSISLSLVCLSLVIAGRAQTPAGGTPSIPAAAPTATLKANSRIVVLDVVVSDAKGNPVRNLKAGDFSLSERGEAQTITHFEDHTKLSLAEAKLPEMPKLAPNIFTNFSPVPVSGALNVLLLDSLNTPLKDQPYVRAQILKYLKTPRPGERMAIFGLTSQLRLLQGFTSDPEVLRNAMASGKATPQGSVLMNNAMAGDTPGQDSPLDAIADAMGNDPNAAQVLANLQQFEAEQQSFQLDMRVHYTLDAMNALGHYLSGLPGRKNLIWFSGSFPINVLPDGDLTDPFAVVADYSNEFRQTTSLLARAQVAVYPIDGRGLMTAPMLDASNSGAKYARSTTAFAKDQAKFNEQTTAEHATMFEMAADTGGKAYVNTNGLAEAVGKAVDAGSNYYTLVYMPTNRDWNGEFRKVQVKLAPAGYTLAYRHGYYANDPDGARKGDAKPAGVPASGPLPLTGARPAPEPARIAMHAAMQFGGPDPTEITFKVAVNPATGKPEEAVATGNVASPKLSGPYERYAVYYAADPRAFEVSTTSPGRRHIAAEFAIFVYDGNGTLLNSTSNQVVGEMSEARYQSLFHGGIQLRQDISVPLEGPSYLRIGVHDLMTDRVGAVEIPVAAVAKLPPLPPVPAAAPVAAPATSAPAGSSPK